MKYGAHGNGDFFVAGVHDGSYGGDGAAAADGGTGGDQGRTRFAAYAEKFAEAAARG
jgi:hypothetical protein